MKTLIATEAVNSIQDGDAVRFVCQICGRMSGRRDDATLTSLPLGWTMVPYPATFTHADGSTGALHTCPSCSKRTDFPIAPREYLPTATVVVDGISSQAGLAALRHRRG